MDSSPETENSLEGCAAWNTLAPPVVATSGEGGLLDGTVVSLGVEREDGVVDVGGSLLGCSDGDSAIIVRAFLVDVGLGGDFDVDVGFGLDVLVDVTDSVGRVIGLGDLLAGGGCGEGLVVGGEELSLGSVHLGGVGQELGGGGGQADDDGENDLKDDGKIH